MSTLLTITGISRDGKVELSQRPEGLAEGASVLVTFLPEDARIAPGPEAGMADAEAAARRAAGERFLARLKRGIPFGGPRYPKREELHDRFDRRDESPGGYEYLRLCR
jgi:hypothetical protein